MNVNLNLPLRNGQFKHKQKELWIGDINIKNLISLSIVQNTLKRGVLTIEYHPAGEDGNPVFDKANQCFIKETLNLSLDEYFLTINGTTSAVIPKPLQD